MTSNVGAVDRAVRLVLGVALIALGLTHVLTGTVAIIAYIVGAIALLTTAVRSCPAWTLLGINTRVLKSTQPR
jgi:Inner membrane protein YgaP-like, transmembrane domain